MLSSRTPVPPAPVANQGLEGANMSKRIAMSYIAVALLAVIQPLVSASEVECGGQACAAVSRGLDSFFDRQLPGLGGNGRACADCHMLTNSFQLAPANVEARYQFLQFLRRFDGKA